MSATGNNVLNGFCRFLIANNFLDEQTTITASAESTQTNQSIIRLLLLKQYISYSKLADAVAAFFRLQRCYLNHYSLQDIRLDILNAEQIKKYFVLPLDIVENSLILATSDPTIVDLQEINFQTGFPVKLVIVEQHLLADAIHQIYTHQLHEELQSNKKDTSIAPNETLLDLNIDDIKSKHSPIVRLLDNLFQDALQKGASDIHFEPYADDFRIRYRLDGILYEITKPPANFSKYIAARLKILANLDITERKLPQDGRFTIQSIQQEREVRLSTCPTLYGEKCVLRIQQFSEQILAINNLGMQPEQVKIFEQMIKEPQGIILVTGPTGSGKTMTLYSALSTLNVTSKNLLSIEDPVEIAIPGINQVQVNHQTKLSFASALRSFLRQDPDIIFIGEIRDLPTAQIAIDAAQTGHLVFSTLHTNSAIETVTRLINLGVAPFNIASSLLLIVAQRLIRKLCDSCKTLACYDLNTLQKMGFDTSRLVGLPLYIAQGCSQCYQGYKGRVGIFEMITMTPKLTELITNHASTATLLHQLHDEQQTNIYHSGLNKVITGITSLEELIRVLGKSMSVI